MSGLRSFTGLKWVGDELGEVIRKARDALEEYVEGGGEPAVLGPCVENLRQVRGVLEMLQLRGAGRLAEEMHASAQALMKGRVASVSEVAEALMLSLIQLPDYLEKLEAGGEDVPLILLPAINDLRSSRGVSALSDAELLLAGEGKPTSEVEGEASAWHLLRAARAARPLLHKGLLKWFRGAEPEDGLKNLREVFSDLERNAESEPLLRGMFRAAHGVIEGLLDHSITADNEVKALVGRVDRVIKQIGVSGVAAADDADLQRVFKDLLHKIERTTSNNRLIRAVKTEYDLEHAFPSDEKLAEARQRMFAPSEDTLSGIRVAAVKELMPIKDTLDLYIRGGRQHADRLRGLEAPMIRLANTLDMAGLSDLGSRLRDGAADIKSIGSGEAPEEDASLMRVAGDLLYVESSLDNVLQESHERSGAETTQMTGGTAVPAGEMRSLITRTLQEAAVDMAKAKEAIVDYIGSPSNIRPLESTPKLFHGIAGALRVISRAEAADVLDQIRDVIQGDLLKSSVLPDQEVLDALADSITCIEYYMEAVAEERADASDILRIAESVYTRLSNRIAAEPIAESSIEVPAIETEIEEEVPEVEIEIEEIPEFGMEMPVAMSGQTAVESESARVTAGIDPEILEIFLEEAREEEPVIKETYERWRNNPADSEALATLRRSFHTLKGSGRLVGAVVIGEFAWSVENLLNRIIDQTLDVSSEITSFLDQAVSVVPELVTAQEANRAPDVDTDALMERAKVLADKRSSLEEEATTEREDDTVEAVDITTELEQSEHEQATEEFLTVEDSELREIFETEAREHLDVLGGFIRDCAQQVAPYGFDDELIRSLHTLAGSARMTGLDPIAVVAKALELKAVALSDQQLGADSAFVALLHDGSVAMAAMVAVLNEPPGAAAPADPDELVVRIEAYEPGVKTAAVSLPEEKAGVIEGVTETLLSPADVAEEVFTTFDEEAIDEAVVLEALEEPAFTSEVMEEGSPGLELDAQATAVEEAEKEIVLEELEPELAIATEPVEEEITLEYLERDLTTVAAEAEDGTSLEDLGQPAPVAESTDQHIQLQDSSESVAVQSEFETAPEQNKQPEPPIEAVDEETTVDGEAPVPGVAVPDEEPIADSPELAESAWEVVSADPELLEIFLEEAQDLVEGLDDGLRNWQSATADQEIPNQLQRKLHTLKGGARLVGIQSIGNLSHAVETLMRSAGAQGTADSVQAVRLLAQRAVDVLSEQVDAVRDGRPIRTGDDLIEALQAASTVASVEEKAETVPIPEPAEVEPEEVISGDRELVEIFLEEAHDLLDQLDNRIREWVRDPDDAKAPEQLKRYLHTLKGGARLAGIQSIGDLSHTLETLLDGASPETVQAHGVIMQLAQRAVDKLTDQVDAVREGGGVRQARNIIQELEYVHGQLESGAVSITPTVTGAPETAPAPKTAPPESVATAVKPQPVYEQVRVRSDLVNRLVNYSGEISIYQSRLEQQNNALGFNLNELEQTVTRLHDQLRQMEIETEAQILYRYEREREEAVALEQEFDPLELDRFSTIQQLSRSLMETVNDLVSIKNLLEEQQKESETLLLQHSRISNDLQDGLLRTRMVPFSQLVPRLHRVVRQTANSLGKRAELQVFGGEGEMDRSILDRMLAPMEHILRNAVSHGIEKPNARRKAGKEESGKISIYLAREGNDVVITVSDDGAGLNLKAIRKRAVETGLLEKGARIDDDDLMQLVLEPGFSTVKEVTQISGRGVGTDVLVSEVKQLGGSLEIASQPGRGTSFSIRLPFTLAISESLLIELGDEVFAVPHPTIEGVVRIGTEEIARCYDGKQDGFHYAGHGYQVRYLGALLGTATASLLEGRKWVPLMLVRTGEHRVAIQVDRILGNRQMVVKSVGPQLSTVRWISGGTILADGRVALILDVLALVRMDVVQTLQLAGAVREDTVERLTKVMVVDDSITVRKVTTRLLKRHSMVVMTAKDGVDAVAKLQEEHPDVMLLDIEMPRMDGYELARHMRNSPELSEIPIIMITSRSGEKHREYALSLGVKRYLGKPFQEATLMDTIFAVVAEAEAEAETGVEA